MAEGDTSEAGGRGNGTMAAGEADNMHGAAPTASAPAAGASEAAATAAGVAAGAVAPEAAAVKTVKAAKGAGLATAAEAAAAAGPAAETPAMAAAAGAAAEMKAVWSIMFGRGLEPLGGGGASQFDVTCHTCYSICHTHHMACAVHITWLVQYTCCMVKLSADACFTANGGTHVAQSMVGRMLHSQRRYARCTANGGTHAAMTIVGHMLHRPQHHVCCIGLVC
eukprot:354195-Chlamydomonas_euryale.AAC.8